MNFLKTVILTVAIATALTGCNHVEVQSIMTKYLEQKYERKFVVEEPKLQGNETMGYSDYRALAYAVDEPDLKFPVFYNTKGKAAGDSYIPQKWSVKGKEITKKEIEEIYGCEVYIWSYVCSYRMSEYDAMFDKIKNLSHDELLEKYGKDCVRNVKVAIFLNRPYDREKEAEMIDQLYNKLFCNREMGHFLFNVGIFDNKHNEEIIKGMDYYIRTGYGFMGKREWEDDGFLYMALKDIRMSRESIDYNKNIDDIKKDFKKYEETTSDAK